MKRRFVYCVCAQNYRVHGQDWLNPQISLPYIFIVFNLERLAVEVDLAIAEAVNGSPVTWLEKVTDEQYPNG